jgi:hypothetical protein
MEFLGGYNAPLLSFMDCFGKKKLFRDSTFEAVFQMYAKSNP